LPPTRSVYYKAPLELKPIMNMPARIIIPSQDIIHLIDQSDILYCQSENCYSTIYLLDGRNFVLVKSLTKLEKELDDTFFIRVNQSFLVNKHFIKTINRKKKQLFLANDQMIPFTTTIKKLIILVSLY
jgi:two-component system LytT family response regulator